MRATGNRESKVLSQLDGWTVAPLHYRPPGVDPSYREVAGRRLPHRFGGWWREWNGAGDELTGREVQLWLRVDDRGVVRVDEVTFRGFGDDFELVPAMRDQLSLMFSVLDAGEDPTSWAPLMKDLPVAEREAILAGHQRRRRANAVDLEKVARLYKSGGAKGIAESEGVSEATAFRWVKLAREAKVLDDRPVVLTDRTLRPRGHR